MRKLLLGFLLLFTTSASATYYFTTYEYTVTYEFSPVAWGKAVKSVYAHVGVLEQRQDYSDGSASTFWDDVQHIPLHFTQDKFVGSAVLKGETGGGDGSQQVEQRGPVVQYWVYFADGTSQTTEVMPSVYSSCKKRVYLGALRDC